MSTVKKLPSTDEESMELEKRKVKALEKIANSLDALTIWFEEIDKKEWGDRLQYYLAEFHNKFVSGNDTVVDNANKKKK